MHTRREFGGIALAGAAAVGQNFLQAAPRRESTVRGVRLGLITGSLGIGGGRLAATQPPPAPDPGRDPVDVLIEECIAAGAANIEWVGPTIGRPQLLDGVIGQPPPVLTDKYKRTREEVRKWILTASLEPFREARKKFDAAGLNWFSGVNTIAEDCTDDEIDALFRQMDAMGLKMFCTNQTRMAITPRLVKYAEKYGIMPAFHTHDKYEDPNEVASADSLLRLIAMSPMFRINLDIGHYTAGNQDAVAFIRLHHDRITHLHVKDRKANHGPNVAWGTGDTPIKECLRVIRDNKYPIYAIVEREYRGPNDGTPVEETAKCIRFMSEALNS